MYSSLDNEYMIIKECLSQLQPLCQSVEELLPESLNFYYLCLLHRDMDGSLIWKINIINIIFTTHFKHLSLGMDSLVTPGRKFIKQGCLFKYTSKGPQQRMFFLVRK